MKLPELFIQALQEDLGSDNVLTDASECCAYSFDNGRHQGLPDIVAFAHSHQQVVHIVKHCNAYKIPLVVRGRGTGTPGGSIPTRGGLVLSLEQMQQIKKIDVANRIMQVEPGVTNQAIQDAAAKHGFFWAPDPGSASTCSVGGNLGYNAAGPRAIKYGTCRENTLGLHVVTGKGESLHVGVYTTKGVVGYDLTRLIIGSEGTLAIITEATLKLTPLAAQETTIQACFSSLSAACHAVANVMAQQIIPCALEFMDHNALQLLRDHQQLNIAEQAQAMLLIKLDESSAAIDYAIEQIQQAINSTELVSFQVAKSDEESKQLWQARKALSPTLRHIAPKKINEDVVVPVAEIATLIAGLDKLSKQYNIPIVNFGHAGNGNIHVNMLFDPDNPAQADNADECLSNIFDLVLQLNGTLSGEHGVGIDKREFVSRELEPHAIQLMLDIKKVFDPNGILNPDKIFSTLN